MNPFRIDPSLDGSAGAIFCAQGGYRYALWRDFRRPGPWALVLGINPSKAGAKNDPTITKMMGFGLRLGWGGFWMANPFAAISPDQRALLTSFDPVGRWNDEVLRLLLDGQPLDQLPGCEGDALGDVHDATADLIVCVVGTGETFETRDGYKPRWAATFHDGPLVWHVFEVTP